MDKVIDFLRKYPAYAYVREESIHTTDHIHAYLIAPKTGIKEPAIRKQLRELTKSVQGNKLYSLTKLDVEQDYAIEYLAYMCKHSKLRSRGLPKTAIKAARKYDLEVKADIKQKKEAKRSRFDRIMSAYDLAKQEYPDQKSLVYHDALTTFDIEFILHWFQEEKCLVSNNLLASWVTTIRLHRHPDISALRQKIYDLI